MWIGFDLLQTIPIKEQPTFNALTNILKYNIATNIYDKCFKRKLKPLMQNSWTNIRSNIARAVSTICHKQLSMNQTTRCNKGILGYVKPSNALKYEAVKPAMKNIHRIKEIKFPLNQNHGEKTTLKPVMEKLLDEIYFPATILC